MIPRTDGTFAFSFEATEADYPGLGTSFSMANLSGDYVDVKWVVDPKTFYGNTAETSIVLSSDHHSIEIDGALAPGHEHVKGTVSCP